MTKMLLRDNTIQTVFRHITSG